MLSDNVLTLDVHGLIKTLSCINWRLVGLHLITGSKIQEIPSSVNCKGKTLISFPISFQSYIVSNKTNLKYCFSSKAVKPLRYAHLGQWGKVSHYKMFTSQRSSHDILGTNETQKMCSE